MKRAESHRRQPGGVAQEIERRERQEPSEEHRERAVAQEQPIRAAERAGPHDALDQRPAEAAGQAEAERGRCEHADPRQEPAPERAEEEPRGVDHRERGQRREDRLELDQHEGRDGRPGPVAPEMLADAGEIGRPEEAPGGEDALADAGPGAEERQPDEAEGQDREEGAKTHPRMLPPAGPSGPGRRSPQAARSAAARPEGGADHARRGRHEKPGDGDPDDDVRPRAVREPDADARQRGTPRWRPRRSGSRARPSACSDRPRGAATAARTTAFAAERERGRPPT